MALNRPKDKPSSSPPCIPLCFHNPLFFIFLFFSIWFFILFFFSSTPPPLPPPLTPENHQCSPDIAPFFIVNLPPRFNSDLLRRCNSLNPYTDMCPHVAHAGLGRLLSPAWHATHQFLAELIFLAAAGRHPCRTDDPSSADLFLLPFYAGLYASSQFSQRNLTLRDSLALDFASLLPILPSWPRRHGRDHFLVLGRTSWDFMRPPSSSNDFGANTLLLLPAVQNLSVLTVERHPWHGRNQFGIPYPSYFHPFAAGELAAWQSEVLASRRTHLFAFVGGARPHGLEKAAARAEILRQCGASRRCLLVECPTGSASVGCYEPDRVLGVMRRAEFCMQPPGDSFTRRSVFDAVLAGCVPVFFSEHTAYTQYGWYEPARPEEWSVRLDADRWGRIEEELDRIPRPVVDQMRARVVEMIPRVTYAHPNASRRVLGFRDAVDVALAELSKIVRVAAPEV